MITLGIDTATPVSSAGLVAYGRVLAQLDQVGATAHAEVTAGLVQRVMRQAGVTAPDRIVVGVGPGPYTGLRVAAVTGLLLAEVWGVPVQGICSLDGIGAGLTDGVVVTDARRREVFAARFTHGRRVTGPVALARAQVCHTWPGVPLVGPAVDMCGGGDLQQVSAAVLALVADRCPSLPAHPWYLRAPDARPRTP